MGGMGKGSSLAAVSAGSWTYNADDELSDETYDQDGNVTAADGKTFSYDSQNELVSMNGPAVKIVYDGDGNRVSKTVTTASGTTTTQYLVDDLNPTGLPQVMDELTNGVVTRTYTYGLERISEDQQASSAWTPSFYSYDGMGSVRQLTDSTGAVTDSYDYDAFGNQISHTGSTPNNYLYRGEQFDSDLGLYYLRARYYNPLSGRFMSRDPNAGFRWVPVTLHKYLYAGGEPVNMNDPSGKDLVEFALQTEEAIPAAKLVDIYGCVAGAAFAAVSLDLAKSNPDWRTAVGAAGATFGCVTLYFPEESENALVQGIIESTPTIQYAFCGFAIEALVNDLNKVAEGKDVPAVAFSDAFGTLTGCVTARLGSLLRAP